MDLGQRLAEIVRRKHNVHPDELDSLLLQAGFVRRQGRGDHRVYRHPRRVRPLTIDPRRPAVLSVYVAAVVRAIREVLEDE